ncbi:MAG: hypothetical protein ACI93H_001427 [Psychromonas sp.]|jgi:hypothetical protein
MNLNNGANKMTDLLHFPIFYKNRIFELRFLTLGSVELWRTNFVQSKSILSKACVVYIVILCNTKHIKFMINTFKGKIYAHQAAGMILKRKSDYIINAFAMVLLVG